MRPPSGQISILGKQNSPLGRLLQPRWVYPQKRATRGGRGRERVEGRGVCVCEELMPTAPQRPPPPPRAERSTGKERGSRGRRRGGGGVQVQGDCQCLCFHTLRVFPPSCRTTTAPPRLYLHPSDTHTHTHSQTHTHTHTCKGWKVEGGVQSLWAA